MSNTFRRTKQPTVRSYGIITAQPSPWGYVELEMRPWKITGQIAPGEWVTAKHPLGVLQGRVCYIHPQRRYFQIRTACGLRESVWFPYG